MSTLRVNGITLYYQITGAGPPLLFLHGLGSSGRDWERQVAHFASHYRVITVDVRGHGRSDKPAGPYAIPLFAADVVQLLEKLDIVPIHLVGLSMGGMIAFQLAVERPELLCSLTIVNSGPEVIIRTIQDRLTLWQRLLIVRLMGMRKMGEILAQRLLPQPEYADLRETFASRWAENDKQAYLHSLKAFIGWQVTAYLGQITTPTLVITAEHDYTPVAVKEAYVAQMPQAELLVIEDARHALPIERPQQFNAALEAFLQKHYCA